MNWLEIKPTPYDQLPDHVDYTGMMGTVKIAKEILYDWGYHMETGTTLLTRVMNHVADQMAERDGDNEE